tara:strand:+ start:76 stop:264 length:189 start_codon:yes stop_codon:yes gene_type:complete
MNIPNIPDDADVVSLLAVAYAANHLLTKEMRNIKSIPKEYFNVMDMTSELIKECRSKLKKEE